MHITTTDGREKKTIKYFLARFFLTKRSRNEMANII